MENVIILTDDERDIFEQHFREHNESLMSENKYSEMIAFDFHIDSIAFDGTGFVISGRTRRPELADKISEDNIPRNVNWEGEAQSIRMSSVDESIRRISMAAIREIQIKRLGI
jgi:hypothetical protein